jgi:hypothetical protein
MKYNGSIIINDEIELNSKLSVDEFKRTKLYVNNDLSKFFWIKKDCWVNDRHFIVGLWFKDGYLKQIQLYNDDVNIVDESQRKLVHDKFLHSITSETNFEWGSINSITSGRDGLSTIVITYK